MNIVLKPNTAIVSVLGDMNLYDVMFDSKNDKPKIMGLQNNAPYSKVKILKVTEQTKNDDKYKQLSIKEGDICIIAKSVISVVTEEIDIKLGFIDTQNIVAKLVEEE